MSTNKKNKEIYAISAYSKKAIYGDEFWTESTPEKVIEVALDNGEDYEDFTVYKLVPVGKVKMGKACFVPNPK